MEPRGHWFRAYEDMGDDPKFRVIAKRAASVVPGVRASDALAVWTQLLCRASAASARGSIEGFDCETADASLDMPEGAACALMQAFEDKGMIHDGRILKWEERQPKREDGSAERAKKWREEQKRTQPNATERNRTLDQNRTEQKEELESFGLSSAAAPADPPLPTHPGIPESEIIRAYHERLPTLPRVKMLNKTRRGHLKARWTEDKSRQSPEWWDEYFAKAGECPHLLGQNDRGWMASWDWLLNPANMLKVLEGNYEKRAARASASILDTWKPKEFRQ